MAVNKTEKDIILINKPSGISSFDVIRKLRKKLGIKKMGHAGTLDPLASGLMIIGIGKGTKKLKDYLKLPKVYEAEILLGIQTDTGDLDGKILKKQKIKKEEIKNIAPVLEKIKGKIKLPVPAYSAIKLKGEPLYKRARRGEKIEPPIKEMEIFWIKQEGLRSDGDHYILSIELEVASGTYIRSIAEEIGRKLGLPATVKKLRRTRIGDFKLKNAKKLS